MPVNIFDVGKSGLNAARAQMQTTSRNMANVNTEGYSRQEVKVSRGPVIPAAGVTVDDIDRVNDKYLTKRLNEENKNYSHAEERNLYLAQAEQVFSESGNEGLNTLLTRFFNDFRKLSAEPENLSMRASVRESSKNLISDLNRMSRTLKQVQTNIDNRIEGYTRKFNALSKEVAKLNILIEKAVYSGKSAPDLEDRRDVVMNELSELASIQFFKDNTGKATINLSRKVAVVNGGETSDVIVQRTPANPSIGKASGLVDIIVEGTTDTNMTDKIEGGRIGALVEVRDNIITDALKKINEVAYVLGTRVNEIHRQGFGLDGGTGRDFFTGIGTMENASEKIKLSDGVLNSLESIATARAVNAPGDNRVAIAISQLADVKGIGPDSKSLVDIYNTMVSDLAVKTESTRKDVEFQSNVLNQLKEFRERISGVSLDEETADLIKFQHAYAANAKVIKMADENTRTLLDLLGR